ncbi:MAG: twin-arginine translocase subunit TatC [Candidatus Aquicultorales bacterium]
MNQNVMGFFEHLDELRSRLMVSAIAIGIAAVIAYFFSFDILKILMRPLPETMPNGAEIKFHYLSVMDPFMARVKIALLGGGMVASPIIFYEVLAFLSPALKENERKWLYPTLGALVVLFMAGALFAYYVIIPPAFIWLLGQGGNVLNPILTVNEYVSFVSMFLLAFGVSFELPLVVLLLIRLGIVKRKVLRENWRYAYVACFTIGALATPDWSPLPMVALGASLVLLFEMALLVARFVEPQPTPATETSPVVSAVK